MMISNRATSQQTLIIEEVQGLIRQIVKNGIFSQKGKVYLDKEIKSVIIEALAKITIPTLRTVAYRSLNMFYASQYRIASQLANATDYYLSVIRLASNTRGPGDIGTTSYVNTISYPEAKKKVAQLLPEYIEYGVPNQTYIDTYFKENIQPTLDRLADDEALDPDAPNYISRRATLRNRAEREVRYEYHRSQLEQLRASGVKLVIISSHADCSERCRPYQGRIFSLDGTSGKTDDGIRYEPIELATDVYTSNGKWKNGLFGFNCRHFATAYEAGMKAPSYSSSTEAKEYKITTRKRELERTVRHWRSRMMVYKGVNERYHKFASDKLRYWSKIYRNFCVKNSRSVDLPRLKLL